MNEKDLLEQLKQSAESIDPPESLSPENIEKMLKATRKDTADSHKAAAKAVPFSVYRLGALVATFAVVIIGSWTAGRYSVSHSIGYDNDTAAIQTTKAAPSKKAAENALADEPEMTAGAELASENTDDAQADLAGEPAITAETKLADEMEIAAETELADDMKIAAETELADEMKIAAETELADEMEIAAEAELADEPSDSDGALTEAAASLNTIGSYENLYDTLFEKFGSASYAKAVAYDTGTLALDAVTEEIAVDTAMEQDSAAPAAGQSRGSSYSTTNVQEAGVDEADIVKTDGDYLYILKRSGSLVILSADGGSLEAVSSLQLPQSETAQEMYVDGSRLSVITSEYYTEMDTSDENVIASRSGNRTKLYTYDITDRSNPVLTGTITQDGAYSQSRKNGEYIYLFTQFSPIIQDTYDKSFLVPATNSGQVEASDIYLPDNLNYSTYLVVSSVNIHSPSETINQKAVISVASAFYASTENIYIANENWDGENTRTELLKLHYENGLITGTAAGSLEGYLNNSFSLSEHNGYLRAVTTSYDSDYNERNGLYILDENLQPVGAIRDLAPDETVRSARFLGDTAYFVTFRQTDPLFSVDLSDPANPQVLGDLKVTGFSSYLHFYSENLLLGLGYEADPETGIQTGLKLSMFDISDPANVTEVSKLVLNGVTWCDALNNYKSILIDPEKNIFGFTCNDRYLVFSYDEKKGFVKKFLYDFYNDMLNGYNGSGTGDTRGLYIDDTLYLVRPDVVNAFDMKNGYQQIGQTTLE